MTTDVDPLIDSFFLYGTNHLNLFSQRVEVYKNLKNKCLSVRAKGRVIARVQAICLREASFVVQPAGHRRVLNEKRKNVHAFIRGIEVTGSLNVRKFASCAESARYDPYYAGYFYDQRTFQSIHESPLVLVDYTGGVFYLPKEQ